MSVSALEAAYHSAEADERAEVNRVIGAVRFLATSAVQYDDLRSRLLDVIDGYDRAHAKTSAAATAWFAEVNNATAHATHSRGLLTMGDSGATCLGDGCGVRDEGPLKQKGVA